MEKANLVRWQERYEMYMDKERLEEVGPEGLAKTPRKMESWLDLFSSIRKTEDDRENFREQGADAWGILYLDERKGMDLDMMMNGFHINIISNIKKKTIANLLSIRIPRGDGRYGEYDQDQRDQIGLVTPNAMRFRDLDIAGIIEAAIWGGSVLEEGFLNQDVMLREQLRPKFTQEIYKLAVGVRSQEDMEEALNFYIWGSRNERFRIPKETILKAFERVLIYRSERSLFKEEDIEMRVTFQD